VPCDVRNGGLATSPGQRRLRRTRDDEHGSRRSTRIDAARARLCPAPDRCGGGARRGVGDVHGGLAKVRRRAGGRGGPSLALTTARKVLANHRRAAESRMRASLVVARRDPGSPRGRRRHGSSSRRSTPWRNATGKRWRSSRGTGSRPAKPRSSRLLRRDVLRPATPRAQAAERAPGRGRPTAPPGDGGTRMRRRPVRTPAHRGSCDRGAIAQEARALGTVRDDRGDPSRVNRAPP
jgi:hypothetical protein